MQRLIAQDLHLASVRFPLQTCDANNPLYHSCLLVTKRMHHSIPILRRITEEYVKPRFLPLFKPVGPSWGGVDDGGFCQSIPAGFFGEEVVKAGYLLKRSLRHKQFNPIWRRQLFILHPQFIRFAKILDSEIYQIVSLTHDTIVQKATKQNNSFEIITPLMAANGHSLLLYTPSMFVLNSWVDAISGAIDQLKLIPSPLVRSSIVSPRLKQEASLELDN